MTSSWGFLTTAVVYLTTLLLIRWVLLLKKQQPASSVAWIMAIVTLPIVGGLLFLIFGINRISRRASEKQEAARQISHFLPELSQYQLLPTEAPSESVERLIRLAGHVGGTIATFGNRIELIDDTNRTLGLIEQAIASARQSIHLEYYIWRSDKTGTRLRDLLIKKAREGVTVRFLFDRIGSLWLRQVFLKPMRDAGVHVASFLPGRTLRERWSLNLRNHRKIVIVDGQTGFTGGMNIGDEYLGLDRRLGFWRDTHLKLQGPTVLQLQHVFAEDWFYATGEKLTQPDVFPEPSELGNVSAQVLAGAPAGEVDVFHALMFAAINEAREQITLATSYFVPPVSLVTALETAAYRGVRVRLLVPGRSAHHWTVLAGRSYYDLLLAAGVEIYEYTRGLMHSKTLTIDGHWSLVGTPNFDTRSLMLNFEVGVAMYEARIAAQLEDQFANDLAWATRIDLVEWMQRPMLPVLAENACRLFAPVL